MIDMRSGGRSRVVRPRRPDSLAALAEIDQRLLGVLCAHRVVTQDQLCRLFPRVPERTLRYRTRRLHELGLAGRSRPYRDRGSAPNHHWPTRRADCLMRGDPLPRGGERREPNPLFLAHAAALTDLYVVLATEAHTLDLKLHTLRREEEAREPFNDGTKNRSLAPDALVILEDPNGRRLWAFVEIDLGTMSHTRLRRKAALYLAYANANAWHGRHPFMPALLFLTTTTTRAYRFLENLATMHRRGSRMARPLGFPAVAGAVAWRPVSLLDHPCLADANGNSHLMFPDVLNLAREPYERAQAARREQERAERAELQGVLDNPTALRERLHKHENRLVEYLSSLGEIGAETLRLLLAGVQAPEHDERVAMGSIARDLDTRVLQSWLGELPPPSSATIYDVELLTEHYRRSQETAIAQLTHRHIEGPSLRSARRTLHGGSLLTHDALARLPADVERDDAGRIEQEQCRLAYEEWRECAARQLAREAGPLGRLTHSREQFYPQLNRKHLKVCSRCEETIYPGSNKPGMHLYNEPITCHYCTAPHGTRPYKPDHHAGKESETQR